MLLIANYHCYTIRILTLTGTFYLSGSESLRFGNNVPGRNLVAGFFDPVSQKPPMLFENIFKALDFSEILHLTRIIFHVDELFQATAEVIYTILVSFCPQHPAVLALCNDEITPFFGLFPFRQWSQAPARQPFWRFYAGVIAKGRKKIHTVGDQSS